MRSSVCWVAWLPDESSVGKRERPATNAAALGLTVLAICCGAVGDVGRIALFAADSTPLQAPSMASCLHDIRPFTSMGRTKAATQRSGPRDRCVRSYGGSRCLR